MLFTEAIRIAFQSLRANKLRSFLTVLGILIGVSSVIAVVAITEGLDAYISNEVLELGSRSFRLQRQPDIITDHDEWREMMKRKRLDLDDLEVVREACSLCSEVGASVGTGGSAKRGRTIHKSVRITGITENISRIGAIRGLEQGRHLVQQDIDQARRVGVVGMDLVDCRLLGKRVYRRRRVGCGSFLQAPESPHVCNISVGIRFRFRLIVRSCYGPHIDFETPK